MEEQIRPILESFEEVKDLPGMRDKIPRNNAHCTIPDDPEESTYRFIIVAAKRARQLPGRRAPGAADVFQEADHHRYGRGASRARKILARATTGPGDDHHGQRFGYGEARLHGIAKRSCGPQRGKKAPAL